MPMTYSDYLELPRLLALQKPRSGGEDHDEMLFIIIHQVYELWFKEVLHEVDYLVALLGERDVWRAQHTLLRVLTVLKTMVGQIDILETMTPLEFLTFRERLSSASGFQSSQFRELELVLGHKRGAILSSFPESSPERQMLEARLGEPSLWDAFVRLLADRGYEIPAEVLERDVRRALEPSRATQKALVAVYRGDPPLAELCERLIDLDEGLQEWRYRHVKMVERTIGARHGTGGSSGVGYLQSTLGRPLFPDLWAVRDEL